MGNKGNLLQFIVLYVSEPTSGLELPAIMYPIYFSPFPPFITVLGLGLMCLAHFKSRNYKYVVLKLIELNNYSTHNGSQPFPSCDPLKCLYVSPCQPFCNPLDLVWGLGVPTPRLRTTGPVESLICTQRHE